MKSFKIASQIGLSIIAGIYALYLGFFQKFTILSNVNFLFHEAGHLILSPFGQWMHFLGGTLFEVGIPIIVGIGLYRQGQKYSSSLILFWLAQVLYGVATYMKDARSLSIQLVVGETHDWNWIFFNAGLLKYDQIIGNFVFILGLASAVSCIGFGIYFSLKERK